MNVEKYSLRLTGKRVLFLAVGEETLLRVASRLERIGANPIGPLAWLIDDQVPIDSIMIEVERLADEEAVYLIDNKDGGTEFRFIISPRSGSEIQIVAQSQRQV